MKRVFLIVFIVFVFIAISSWLFLRAYEKRSLQEQFFYKYTLSDEEYKLIRDGDIILRQGYGLVSDLIVEQLKEKFDISHCAIICKTDSGFAVIHSVSSSVSNIDGMQVQDLKSFIAESKYNSVVVIRYKPKAINPNASISRKAKSYLTQKIPFDEAFDIADSTEFYCTELLWKTILNEYTHDIMEGKNNERKDHLRFDTFLDTNLFKVVINHQIRKK